MHAHTNPCRKIEIDMWSADWLPIVLIGELELRNSVKYIFLKDVETAQCDSKLCLTLTLPGPSAGVNGSLDSYCSLKPLCLGMGEVVPARTSPTLLPPSPRTVLSLSSFIVLQCINYRG